MRPRRPAAPLPVPDDIVPQDTQNAASLFVIRGHDQGRRFKLHEGTVQAGRDPSNTIQLHDTEVSRRHAEFRYAGNRVTLHDLNSSNGSFINGRKIQSQQLHSGDQIQLGGTVLLFTGAADESHHDHSERVSIVGRGKGDESRIVRTMTHAEGSQLILGEENTSPNPFVTRARSNLQIMYRTALAISHTLDIDQLLNRILQLIFEWIEADRGCIMLLNDLGNRLEPKASQNRQADDKIDRIEISQTILDYVLEKNEGVLTSDAREDQRWNPAASIVRLGIREAICAPMQGRYGTVGIIYVDTSTPADKLDDNPRHKFSEEHLKLMIAIGHQAALAVEDTRYYSAMVQAERMAAVGQTIATLSHHIKNILQGIRGGSYLIDEGLSKHDEAIVRKGWSFVERNQEKISNLVMDMLSFSKERVPDLQAAELNQVVRDVFELQQTRAAEFQVALTFEPQEGVPEMSFDPDGLHRAVLNVVTNAIDACSSSPGDEPRDTPGAVRIHTEFDPEQRKLRAVIEDNGVGIPESQLESIFTPFHSSKGSRGTGLGLPVSRKILREHGGDIRVESVAGRGSRFILEFPATPVESIKQTVTGRLEDFENGE